MQQANKQSARRFPNQTVVGRWRGLASGVVAAVRNSLRRIVSKPLGMGLAAAAIILVAGWRTVVTVSHPGRAAHWREIAQELGSVAEFWGEPKASHAGTSIVFQQSTETGVGVFLCDLASGRRELLYEQPELNWEKNREQLVFKLWGWSPGDQFFAYSRRPGANESKHELVICDGASGKTEVVMTVYSPYCRNLAWLSDQAFAFTDSRKDLYQVVRRQARQWSRPSPFQKSGKPVPRETDGLLAVNSNTVAWQQGQAIWAWAFGAAEPVKLWEATTNRLVDFDADLKGRQWLVQLKDRQSESFATVTWPSKTYTELGRVRVPESYINNLVWFDGEGHAFRAPRGIEDNTIHIQTNAQAKPTQITFNAGLNSFIGNGREVYVVGSQSGEPMGIWKYTPATESLVCVVSNPQPAFRYARAVVPTRETVTNAAGNVIAYRLWSPPSISATQSYPLLIGKMSGRWNSYPAVAANGGAYVVSLEREHKFGDWNEAPLQICELLKQRLRIDPARIYLYGNSADTPVISRQFDMTPAAWGGIILYSPVAFPQLTSLKPSHRMLIDFGEHDRNAATIATYVNEAARSGIIVTAVGHPNAEHVYRTTVTIRARDQALMDFLSGGSEEAK